MTGKELHRFAYNFLMEYKKSNADFTFWFRQRGEEKFKSGFIFQGNENYAFVGLYDRGGGSNMTRSVGIVFDHSPDGVGIKLENAFNEEVDSIVLDFYEQMRKIIGGFNETGKTNFQKRFNPSTQIDDLHFFLNDQKPKLDNMLKDLGLEKMLIDQAKFNKMLQKVQSFIDPKEELTVEHNPAMIHPLNQILFGPPGTGKTYNSIDKAVTITTGRSGTHAKNKVEFDRLRKEGQIEFVTFHQGYSYEDFMVGIKPNTDTEQLTFRPHKGIFYKIVEKAKANYIANKDQKQELTSFDTVFEELIAPLEDGKTIDIPMKGGSAFTITDVDNGTIRFNKPKGFGGHTLSVNTLKAIVEGKREFNSGLGVYYKPLVQLIHDRQQPTAAPTPLKNFVIIIDEINRANISKVFGELITLLEDDKRMGAENALSLTLPNGEPDFSIPPNVYIIGTMNTADKSIALVDIALRRRFEFEGRYPDYNILEEPSRTILHKINDSIYARKKTADFLIGHGYFMKKEPLDTVLLKKVIPLLMEYFSGRTEEVQAILKSAGINAEYNTQRYVWVINATTGNETHN